MASALFDVVTGLQLTDNRGFFTANGNVVVNALTTSGGLYWTGNGKSISGIAITASDNPPTSPPPSIGDQWYNTSNDVVYQYQFDGTSTYWVDISTSVITANASVAVDTLITDSIKANVGAFQTYANTKIGTNTNGNLVASNVSITSNLTVAASGLFQGPYNENSIISGVFVGNTGTAPGITPRVGFFNGNTQQNWQIDNNGGEFRWFVPGSTRLSLYPNGNLNVTGSLTLGGKKAVNGPAFSAYASATLQTITSDSQQKVLFQTEEFDTDGCYASSRFTPTVEGYYQLNSEVRLDGASGTGEMMIVIWKNGSEHKRGTNQQGTQIATNFWAMTVSSLVYANGTGDYFEIYVQQTSGSSMSVTTVNSPNITWFNGAMVRGA
jgi:hypothetical protein